MIKGLECLCGESNLSNPSNLSTPDMCRYHNECGVCPFKAKSCECENYNCIICLKVPHDTNDTEQRY